MPVAREETGKDLSLFSLGEKQVLGNGQFFLLSVASSQSRISSLLEWPPLLSRPASDRTEVVAVEGYEGMEKTPADFYNIDHEILTLMRLLCLPRGSSLLSNTHLQNTFLGLSHLVLPAP